MISLLAKNITAGYGSVDIINDLNLFVNEGEIVVIVGPNGAGKSTAMKAMLGMLKLTNGSVEFSGNVLHASADVQPAYLGTIRAITNEAFAVTAVGLAYGGQAITSGDRKSSISVQGSNGVVYCVPLESCNSTDSDVNACCTAFGSPSLSPSLLNS